MFNILEKKMQKSKIVNKGTKCIMKGCKNHTNEGKFVGDLCAPCHSLITTGKIEGYGCGVFGATIIENESLKEQLSKMILKELSDFIKVARKDDLSVLDKLDNIEEFINRKKLEYNL